MKAEFWAADTFRFSVTGPGTFRFLNRAAASGVRLRRVRWQKDGYTAQPAARTGADWKKLQKAAAGRLRSRPARSRAAHRMAAAHPPGLVAGAVLFFVLLRFLGGFVWCIDYGAMDTDLHAGVRTLLGGLRHPRGRVPDQTAFAGGPGPGAAPQRDVRLGQPELYRRLPFSGEYTRPDPDRARPTAPAGPVRCRRWGDTGGGN